MQRASVRERPSQSLSRPPSKPSKTTLRVIEGGASVLPDWLELLGLLLFIFAHRKKKQEPALFDEIPDTGVHQIPVYRPTENGIDVNESDGIVTDERLDEILRDAVPVPTFRFHVSGEKTKPVAKKKAEPVAEREPFPTKVSAHALGQFARAYLKARGQLGEFIDRSIEQRLGKRKASELNYDERIRLRKLERKAMADLLVRIARDEGRILRDTQERLEGGIEVVHIGRGPTKSYFARFDPVTGVVLGFYSAQGFNRHKAYRRARKKSHREGGRRFH